MNEQSFRTNYSVVRYPQLMYNTLVGCIVNSQRKSLLDAAAVEKKEEEKYRQACESNLENTIECHVLTAAEREKCGGGRRQSRASGRDRWTNLKFDGSRDGKWEKESVRTFSRDRGNARKFISFPLLSRRYVGFHALVISSILLKERRESLAWKRSPYPIYGRSLSNIRGYARYSCSRDYPYARDRFHRAAARIRNISDTAYINT